MAEFEFRVATEFNVVRVRVSKDVQDRVDQLTKADVCLGCEEKIIDLDRRRRGLCSTCYGTVRNVIRRQSSMERKLMEDGKLLPKCKGGRKAKNAFTASLTGRPIAGEEVKAS